MATLTVYPDPNPETTSVDGSAKQEYIDAESVDWATIRGAAGNGSTESTTTTTIAQISCSTLTDKFQSIWRGIFLFNTVALGSGATITAAILSLYGNVKNDTASWGVTLDIYTSNPASNIAVANGDFDSLGATSQTGAPISYASFSTTGYNDFTFNATGMGNISKTGVSKFGTRIANYDAADIAPTWSSGAVGSFNVRMADYASTTEDPKLVITYTPGAGAAQVPRYGFVEFSGMGIV